MWAEEPSPESWLARLTTAVTTPAAEVARVEWRGAEGAVRAFRLEAVVEGPGTFLYQLTPEGGGEAGQPVTVYSEGGQGLEEVPGRRIWRELQNPLEPLFRRLGTTADRAFPRLAWTSQAWPPPSAEHLEVVVPPPEECPAAPCRRLVLTWPSTGCRVEYLLAVAPGEAGDEAPAVRLLTVRLGTGLAAEDFARTAQALGLPPAPRWGTGMEETWLTVRFEAGEEGPEASTLAADFRPWQDSLEDEERLAALSEVYFDSIDVRLATLKIRPVDRRGAVVQGLRSEDLRLRVGRQEVPIEALDWVPAAGALAEATPEQREQLAAAGVEPEAERLVVLFVHTDFEGHRQMGLWRMVSHLAEFLERLDPRDRVAVVSFDSHLKLRLDFTRDAEAIIAAARAGVRRHPVSPLPPGPDPSLAAVLDFAGARRAGFVEVGIQRTAEALARLPGEKLLFLFSWGLGGEHGGATSGRYWRMVEALAAGRIPVSSAFVSTGTSNLTGSVARIAAHTGGTFVQLYGDGLGLALERLGNTLGGHYVVTFTVPERQRAAPVWIAPSDEAARRVHGVLYPPIQVGGRRAVGR
jgi:hypothetical protein